MAYDYIAYEPIEGDSLTRYVRSMQNMLAGTGQDTYKKGDKTFDVGQNLLGSMQGYLGKGGQTINAGQGIVSSGLGMMGDVPGYIQSGTNTINQGKGIIGAGGRIIGEGAGQYQSGVNSVAPALDFLTRLVKGDQADITQAIEPEANRIREGFSAARSMVTAQPRGGGKAGVMAEMPFKEQQQIADTAAMMRRIAPGELGNLGTTLAGLGLNQENVGLGVGQLGLGVGNLGLGEQQTGLGYGQLGLGLIGQGTNQQQIGLGQQNIGIGVGGLGLDQMKTGLAQQGIGAGLMTAADQAALTRRAQNNGENQAMMDMLGGLGKTIGTLLGDWGGRSGKRGN